MAKSADHVQTAHPDKVGGFAFGPMVTFNRTDEKDADAAFGAQSSQSAVYAIETAHVSKMMERDSRPLQVLRDVNFHAEEGEFVSIIGPSGCGKSTLLNIIAGLDSPTSGSVALHGGTDRLRLGSVGYMQQKDLLMPWRSVLDNATLGLELQGVSKRDAGQRARQHLGRFGLEGFENAYPHELSGGMRQRAAFLRTVLADQEVFLLDEPFGALDALNRTQIHQWLTSLWESMQKTIVLVTHDVDESILLSDRVYVMSARPGRMKMVQSVDLSRPRSIDVFSTPAFMALKSALLNSIREEAPEESYL